MGEPWQTPRAEALAGQGLRGLRLVRFQVKRYRGYGGDAVGTEFVVIYFFERVRFGIRRSFVEFSGLLGVASAPGGFRFVCQPFAFLVMG